jgi:hypothetical protein
MNALTIITRDALPPGRARLIALNRRLADADRALATLVNGRDRLRSELSRADNARNELDSMIAEDASSLVGKLRSGASWALSHFGSPRAMNLLASLSESHLQNEVGSKALAAIEAEISVAEREVADLKALRPDAILAVMKEASAGYVADLDNLADDLRQTMTILSGLDRITATPTGEWSPNQRVVVTLPSIGGLPETIVISPTSEIEKARSIWAAYAQELEHDALAKVGDHLKFPSVDPHADAGLVPYETLHPAERRIVDLENAGTRLGVN